MSGRLRDWHIGSRKSNFHRLNNCSFPQLSSFPMSFSHILDIISCPGFQLYISIRHFYVESKRERMKKLNCVLIQTEGKTMDLYMKEREGKLNADCQSRSPMPIISAELLAWGQARQMGAGAAGGGRRSQWGPQATSHQPRARACQPRTLEKPPGQIRSQHSPFGPRFSK